MSTTPSPSRLHPRDLVGVTLGLFADGMVEVEGGGLRAGDRVVVPA